MRTLVGVKYSANKNCISVVTRAIRELDHGSPFWLCEELFVQCGTELASEGYHSTYTPMDNDLDAVLAWMKSKGAQMVYDSDKSYTL